MAAAFDPPVRPFAPVGDEVPRRDGETPEELVRRLALAANTRFPRYTRDFRVGLS